MSTLVQMRSRIADDLNRSDLSTQIDRAINRAIEHYESEGFWFDEKIATFNTVASQENYGSVDSIPTDIKEIDFVQVTISGRKFELYPRTYDYIKRMNASGTTGEPYDYCYYQENFYLSPIPNAVRTITVSYQQKYSTLSADGDSNDFTTDAEDLIENHAKADIYANTLHEPDEASRCWQMRDIALNALRAKTYKLKASGKLVPTSF